MIYSNNVYGPVGMRHVLEMPATLKTVSGCDMC